MFPAVEKTSSLGTKVAGMEMYAIFVVVQDYCASKMCL